MLSQFHTIIKEAPMILPSQHLTLLIIIPGHIYAFTIDVAGTDEALLNLEGMGNPGRDSTTLSIVDVDLSTLETLQSPTYRIVHRQAWQGISHLVAFGKLKAFADIWQPQYLIVDATGVGEGLWVMLDKAFPEKVIPVKFTQQEKSEVGYRYIMVIETGRVRDCVHTAEVHLQYTHVQSEILIGPAKTMRWGVPDGTRDSHTGELIHDDHVTADSLISKLDELEWIAPIEIGLAHKYTLRRCPNAPKPKPRKPKKTK